MEERASKSEPEIVSRQITPRSYSADVTDLKDNKRIELRRHTECINTRWTSQTNDARLRRESSHFSRFDSEATNNATWWTTIPKNPSPGPIPKINLERGYAEHSRLDEGSSKNADKWQPTRKFSPMKNEKGYLQRQEGLDIGRDYGSLSSINANERANKLSQRMRDLHDFKKENEWPKRTDNSQMGRTWISKSSSEEDRTSYLPVRRNSQELEFNDRINRIMSKAQREKDGRKPKHGVHDSGEVFVEEKEDDHLRRFNERLRYCENMNKDRVRVRQRRTYSDDYDEVMRESRQTEPMMMRRPQTPARRLDRERKERKRNSDFGMKWRELRINYTEVDFTKRDPRASSASYANVKLDKRGSVECISKSTLRAQEVPPRRAYSQSDDRPASPVPPIEWNDEHYVPKKLSEE